MADRPISALPEATSIQNEDLLLLQQGGVAKRISGETFLDLMSEKLRAHGGISTIEKTHVDGLVDTYTMTFADGSTYDYEITNGKTISSIEKTGTDVLVDTYTVQYNDGSSSTFQVTNGKGISRIDLITTIGLQDTYRVTYNDGSEFDYIVTNGEKGDQGDFVYVWIKYSTSYPSRNEDMHDSPDNYIGIYTGFDTSAPTSYLLYNWFEMKGEKGDHGEDLTIISTTIEYGTSPDSVVQPTNWGSTLPTAPQGYYMWTRIKFNFSSGTASPWFYTCVKNGQDGQGGGNVQTVNGVSPVDGDISLISVEDNILVIREAT